jgi:thiol-disulfide isomerase/thioredoxin
MVQKLLALTVLCALSFTSVSAAMMEKDSAMMLSEKWVIAASSDYRLSDTITRKEIMKIVMNLSGKSVSGTCSNMFSDVANDWGCKYIESALANGFIAKNAKFRPNDSITKAESMKLIAQARGLAKVQTTNDWQVDWMMTGYKNSLSEKYTNHNSFATRGWIFWLGANEIKMMSDTMMKDDTMEKDDVMVKDDVMMKKEGVYTDYSASLLGTHATTVLFFHAAWCPSCRTADAGIKAADISGTDIAVLKVDYDTSDDLKKKYEVTYQHTFVQVDANGELIKKWSGSNSISDIADNIQ